MHAHTQLLETFYTAFARRDGAAMAACYTPDAHFSDPAFDVHGDEVGAMWTMLCERGRDLQVTWSGLEANDATGSAHWEASYSFSATGRPVHNVITSAFTFRDGRIATQIDSFDLWRWTRMALGTKGLLLGWTPLVRKAVRAQARRGLDAWIARRA